MKIKILLIIGVVLVILGVAGLKFYSKNNDDSQLIAKVGKLMVLPNEIPKIATVTDNSKLVNQKFFSLAENGDKVLIFVNATKAILYREKINKVIDVASVLPSTTELTVNKMEVVDETPLTAALYNGTKKAGLTDTIEKKITEKFKKITIQSKEKAARSDFEETIIVDVGGKNKALVDDLAETLGAKVSPLPEGETKPEVDLIIILGKNSI